MSTTCNSLSVPGWANGPDLTLSPTLHLTGFTPDQNLRISATQHLQTGVLLCLTKINKYGIVMMDDDLCSEEKVKHLAELDFICIPSKMINNLVSVQHLVNTTHTRP